jgi:hypothetical protein
MPDDSEFVTDAIAAGFTRTQAIWLEENCAEEGHSHEIEDIEGLEELLQDLPEDDCPEETETP